MAHLQGGKVTGSHTTLTEDAKKVTDFLVALECITKIALGVISNNGGKSVSTVHSVKIVDESACVLVRVTQRSTVQELRFYTHDNDRQKAKLALARFVREHSWALRFGKAL